MKASGTHTLPHTSYSMGGGKGRTKGGSSSKLPTLSSLEDLDCATKDAATKASEEHKRGHVIILDFEASWCSVCQKIAPFYDKLAEDPKLASADKKVILYKIDVDESPDLTNRFGASALPLFVILVDGKQVDTLVGAQQTALKKKILMHASSKK